MTAPIAPAVPSVIPQPVTVEPRSAEYLLSDDLAIATDQPGWSTVVRRLLSPGTGLELPSSPDGTFRLNRDDDLAEEAYVLEVGSAGIEVTASSTRGVNWAVQTLRQLLPPSVLRPAPTGERLSVAGVRIADEPRFGWRGVHLDVGRHFMPLAGLFRFVDLAALHKYNVFHLHLTEDQGWRFASTRYPKLQERASWRTETRRHLQDHADGTPHGGFYTADQLRSLVRYAADRGITVMPELDFPGHVLALLSAYPELGNHPESGYQPATTFGVFPEVLNLSDETMMVVFDLYDELLEVFDSSFIHLGGDECPRDEWLASPAAQTLAEQRGLPGPEHLQRWFTEQLRDWLVSRGRRVVGWDEINDDGPLDGSITMAWRDASYGARAAAAGLDVVMCPLSHTYFDYYPSDDPAEPYAIGGLTTLEQAYAFEPLADLPAEAHARVLGTQCQVWREYLPDTRRVDYMLYPRACAHAEVAWSRPDGRSYPEFLDRLRTHLDRLTAIGVEFRPLDGPLPWQTGGTGALRRPVEHGGPAA
ncbi:MAG: beta-N-acetylhexosaminidase [Microlunatus sp.]|nr:beta-N-acetylhexosaminidase [Microlunatus sp.]